MRQKKPNDEISEDKVFRLLNIYRVEKYEIYFIIMYRYHLLLPDLKDSDIWDIALWDLEWIHAHNSLMNINNMLALAIDNVDQGQETLYKGDKMLKSTNGVGVIPIDV